MSTQPAFLIRVDPDLHKEVRVKSVEIGRPVSSMVRQWLRMWVSGELPTPPPEGEDEEP